MRRSLSYYWRGHLAVAVGAAVATAVLTGALLVGDSLRGSLAELAEKRLGSIEHAVAGGGFFRGELAGEIAAATASSAAPVVLLRGSGVHAASSARASKVQILGVDARFSAFYRDSELDFSRLPAQIHPSVVLNQALASELAAALGDDIILTFEQPAKVPRETVVGRQSTADTVATLRLSVRGIISSDGLGGFSLRPSQTAPLSAFVELERLQRKILDEDRVNLVVTSGLETRELETSVRNLVQPDDLGLILRAQGEEIIAESRQFVMPRVQANALETLAEEVGATVQPVLTYLANTIEIDGKSVPYSTVTALDPLPGSSRARLSLLDGQEVAAIADDEILLNQWAALDLEAAPGDTVDISFYGLGPRDELTIEKARFRLAGIVRIDGLAADPRLTPDYPGMHDADDISAWDPPFPVDLGLIRQRDEDYWDLYGATPKAFLSAATGRRLWTSRFGDRTSIRILPPATRNAQELTERMLAELPARLGDAGLTVLPVRQDALRQARGATDFAGLFFGLSLFLIASSALLVGLLFRLAVEQRSREVGLLRAVGFTERKSRRRFLAEGLIVAGVGALAGVAAGVGYAWLMLTGLRTWWLPAIGAPVLFLHVRPSSMIIGFVASLVVVASTIWLSLRQLRRLPIPGLLAGSLRRGFDLASGRRPRWIAGVAGALALALLAVAMVTDRASNPALAFGVGTCLLVAGIALFSWRCTSAGRTEGVARPAFALLAMSVRNSGRYRSRSVLSVALVASAVFSIVAVAANRGREEIDVSRRFSGGGGFELMAESDIPILDDLSSPAGRAESGLAGSESALENSAIFALRLLPGDDASCLNLYRPEKPRILGVSSRLVERGGFAFQQVVDDSEDPWRLLGRDLGPGVVPAFGDYNSVKWILHSGLGKEVLIVDEAGREVALRFVGLLKKSIFQSEILISETQFSALFPRHAGASYFLIDPPDDGVREAHDALESGLARYGFDVTPTAQRLTAFQAIENTYISTFETLGGLGLVLGTLGLGIVLLRNVLERRSELATMRAFGFRRRRLARLVLLENAYLLTSGVAIGAVAGISAAAPHLLAAGSGFPWRSVGVTLAAVLVVGLLSSFLAVRQVVRAPLISALKSD